MPELPLRAGTADAPPTFWQRPFVQDVLPFCTSLMFHLGLIALGVVTYRAITIVTTTTSVTPPVVADTFISNDPVTSALRGLPTGADDVTMQDKVILAPPESEGFSTTPTQVAINLPGGSAATASDDDAIAAGLQPTFANKGRGTGLGKGDQMGTGDGALGLAPFGNGNQVGNGVIFHKTPANKVVFLCDSSGSMMNKFDALRQELRKAVDALKPTQQFDIVFFAADRYIALDNQLLYALPENKRRAYAFLDGVSPHDTSNPIPGLRAAFATKPELIYLLTDGDFPDNKEVLAEARKLNPNKLVTLNTVAFIEKGEEYEKFLHELATDHKGVFKFVGEKDLQPQP